MGWDLDTDTTKRGSLPSPVEYCILAWVCIVLYCTVLYCTVLQVAGLIWSEIKQLWDVGLKVVYIYNIYYLHIGLCLFWTFHCIARMDYFRQMQVTDVLFV